MSQEFSPQKVRRLQVWLKRLGYLCALGLVLYFVYRYDIERIPDNYPHLLPQHMEAGSRVVSTNVGASLSLGLGSVVVYESKAGNGGLVYGVIAGLPGEEIQFGRPELGEANMMIADRREPLDLPSGHAIPEGKIPKDHYLILLGDRHIARESKFPDARRLGLTPRTTIRKKLIASLAFF